MSQHIDSIVAWFIASGSGLSAIGGPWKGQAPPNTAYPYCVFHDVGGRPHAYMGGTFIKPATVRFDIFHTDDATLATYQTALHSRFDEKTTIPAVGNNYMLYVRRVDDWIRHSGGVSKTGVSVYIASSTFRFEVENRF